MHDAIRLSEPPDEPKKSACPRLADEYPEHLLRRRLIRAGPSGLTNTELLTLVVKHTARKAKGLQVAESLLHRHGLKRIPDLTFGDWRKVPGVGAARACQLVAAFELLRRSTDRVTEEAVRVS